MNSPVAKRLPWLGLIGILLIGSLVVAFAAHSLASPCIPATPGDISCSRPYIKATGGDLATGGWFNNGNTLCDTSTSSNYQDPNFTPSGGGGTNPAYGGILTYAKTSGSNSAGGSSEEFAAYALGLMQGNSTNGTGFYTGGALARSAATNKSYLSFANTMGSGLSTPADFWGGMLVAPSPDGVRQTSYCLPDYFTTKMPSPVPTGLPGNKLNNGTVVSGDGAYYETATGSGAGAPLDLVPNMDITIPAGRHITVFVKGTVYIQHNIAYAAYTADHVPKFALVVEGSIYIAPSVTRLDGLYIAQPDLTDANSLSDDTGNIWTCHDDTTDVPSYTFPAYCTDKLVVNGAFVAKQINLFRTPGDIVSASTSEDGFASAPSSNASEVTNFSPAMVMGGTFFYDSPKSSDIDSLISLPPVF